MANANCTRFVTQPIILVVGGILLRVIGSYLENQFRLNAAICWSYPNARSLGSCLVDVPLFAVGQVGRYFGLVGIVLGPIALLVGLLLFKKTGTISKK